MHRHTHEPHHQSTSQSCRLRFSCELSVASRDSCRQRASILPAWQLQASVSSSCVVITPAAHMYSLVRLAQMLVEKGPHKAEHTPRRVRGLFNGKYAFDTIKAVHVWEHPNYPQSVSLLSARGAHHGSRVSQQHALQPVHVKEEVGRVAHHLGQIRLLLPRRLRHVVRRVVGLPLRAGAPRSCHGSRVSNSRQLVPVLVASTLVWRQRDHSECRAREVWGCERPSRCCPQRVQVVWVGHVGHWELHGGVELGDGAGCRGVQVEGRLRGQSVRHWAREVQLEHGDGGARWVWEGWSRRVCTLRAFTHCVTGRAAAGGDVVESSKDGNGRRLLTGRWVQICGLGMQRRFQGGWWQRADGGQERRGEAGQVRVRVRVRVQGAIKKRR
jgi:hypothetical protein